jgi:hypothetical protein
MRIPPVRSALALFVATCTLAVGQTETVHAANTAQASGSNCERLVGRANAESFARLYILPGAQHCDEAPSPFALR